MSKRCYTISVVAREVGLSPVTLRRYASRGLISTYCLESGVGLLSEDQVERLKKIQRLRRDLGVNLAGVEVILRLLDRIERLESSLGRPTTKDPGID